MLSEDVKICERCGSEYHRPTHYSYYSPSQWAKRRFCGRKCSAEANAIERHGALRTPCACGCGKRTKGRYIKEHKPAWRGVTASGHIRLWRPGHPLASKGGLVLEHRYVLYESGVEIPEGYAVHHINDDPADNRIENLRVMPHGDHTRLHLLRDGVINQYGHWPVRIDKADAA